VRLSGQDSRRGTFSQRHSVLVDTNTGRHHTPLSSLDEGQTPFSGYDSMLSENAVLGFEYGYSLAAPGSLIIWEAQFGDFANNAQVVIDQLISSAQAKWRVMSGLVLLLPHAFEGQGPEHSSGRLERFLQLCAEENIQVCNATTPAQYFHLLRRQVKHDFRKPLVVMTPKSLLRHPKAVSRLSDLESGHFREMLEDAGMAAPPRRVLICSGKVYYDLLERREALQTPEPAILRLEQFYPFPSEQIKAVTAGYPNADEWLWVQEEPRNMGGWAFVQQRLKETIGRDIGYIGRREAAAPASGHIRTYREEQCAILDEAVGRLKK
jgi:2-oxoglutarate dehydrogenase E1 component